MPSDTVLTPGQGGQTVYSPSQIDKVRAAIADFSVYSQDPKAAVILLYARSAGNSLVSPMVFYDAPTPPPGTFDNFTNVPAAFGELKTRPYLDMLSGGFTPGLR